MHSDSGTEPRLGMIVAGLALAVLLVVVLMPQSVWVALSIRLFP